MRNRVKPTTLWFMISTVVLLAAGMSTRYGRLKQLEPVGPCGEALLDFSVFDARRAGFSRILLIIREELEEMVRAHVEERWPGDLEVVFHHQKVRDLPGAHPDLTSSPACIEALERRAKPWGTGHALLTARPHLPGPFVLLNADDFYGEAAFHQGAEFLLAQAASSDGEPPGADPAATFGLVTYTLSDTLSEHGGVSRGICTVDLQGRLAGVQEILEIRRAGGEVSGKTVSGQPVVLDGTEPISTNFWIFSPDIFPILEEEFQEFLRDQTDPSSAQTEFLIPSVVNGAVRDRIARVMGIPTRGRFLGITHPEDRDWVAGGLEEMTHGGHYPSPLWG